MSTKIRKTAHCACAHARSRHRQAYGEPYRGACRDCNCGAFREGSCQVCFTYPCSCAELAADGRLCPRCGALRCECEDVEDERSCCDEPQWVNDFPEQFPPSRAGRFCLSCGKGL